MPRITKIRGETITLATSRTFATVRGIPPGFNVLELEAPSATIEAVTVGFGPRIKAVYFYDASAGTWRDDTAAATDRNPASLVDVSVMQTADRLYIGTTRRAEGYAIDVIGTNGAGTANAVYEYPLGTVWTDLSATDGTDSTATFDQDGLVTWTVPTTNGWTARMLKDVAGESVPPPETDRLYWTRMRPSAAITDTSTTLGQISALMKPSSILPQRSGQSIIQALLLPLRITSIHLYSQLHPVRALP